MSMLLTGFKITRDTCLLKQFRREDSLGGLMKSSQMRFFPR